MPFERCHRRSYVTGILLAVALVFGSPGRARGQAAESPGPSKRVLLLYSDERMLPAGILVDGSIRETFAGEAGGPVEIHSEFLDRARFPGREHAERQRDFFREKYREKMPDLVIAGGAPALNFLIEFRASLFPEVPIVHCAVSDRQVPTDLPDAGIVGIPLSGLFTDSLELALRVQPEVRKVAVVSGTSERTQEMLETFRKSVPAFGSQVEFIWLTDLSIEDLRGAVSRLPKRSIVLYLAMFEDAKGRSFVPRDALDLFAPASAVPIYGAYDTYLGHGIVGGSMVPFKEIGRKAARIAIRILSGEAPPDAANSESQEPVAMFDWNQLRRWNIPENLIPPGSVVLNREPNVWVDHRGMLLAGIGFCGLETLLIGLLLVQLSRRRRAEASLRESERRMSLAVDAANFGIWIRDLAGKSIWATKKWRDLFGFTSDEPLDLDRFFGRLHPDDRDAVVQALEQARESGARYEREYRIVLPDAGLRWLSSLGSVEFHANGKAVRMLGVCRDCTLQKLAEESARDLTGRLIHAQEETQRRLSRELHDDLSQSLALLSVEMEMLGQNPPAEPGRIAARMEDFSTQAKRLSSEVHRLSHELHPAKLDQLGLVAALRGFCREFAFAHEMAIDFAECGVPLRLPDDVALCLYRITQEALHNVVKHSGATAAKVSLAREGSELRLSITDDGRGFDPQSERANSSLGVVSMGERARFARGRISIDSSPGAGTSVEVRIPLDTRG